MEEHGFMFCGRISSVLQIFLGCRENLNLFARKFSETIDKGLIDEILVSLKNERN